MPQASPVALLAVLTTIVTWAAAFAAIGVALREIAPLPLAAVRFALAALPALAWLAWRRTARPSARDAAIIALSGLLGIATYNVLLNLGQTTVSAGAASFIVNTQPIFMALLAVLFLRERFAPRAWFGAMIGLAGVAIIAHGQPGGIRLGSGWLYILGAAAAAAAYSVLQRPILTRAHPLDLAAAVLLAGAVALLPWLPSGLQGFAEAGPQTRAAVVFLAVAPAAIGQTCWTVAIAAYGAARAGQFLYLVPPTAVAITWAWLGEAPTWLTLAGGCLAMAGVLVVNLAGRRR